MLKCVITLRRVGLYIFQMYLTTESSPEVGFLFKKGWFKVIMSLIGLLFLKQR